MTNARPVPPPPSSPSHSAIRPHARRCLAVATVFATVAAGVIFAPVAHAAAGHAEFKAWQWAGLGQLADLIVPFKRELYTRVVAELGPHIR